MLCDGREVFLPLICYHVEHAAIRLMNPQLYFKRHVGYGTVSNHNVTFHLPDRTVIDIPIDARSNLPMVHNVGTTSLQQEEIGPLLMSTAFMVGDFEFSNKTQASMNDSQTDRLQDEPIEVCYPCVATETNQQLTGPQKELLIWH